MARTYNRDARGRFAAKGAGGGKPSGGKAKASAPAGLPPGLSKEQWARYGAKSKPAASGRAANKVAASPRRLNKYEQIAAEVFSSSKFRSDRQRTNEMIRRGVSPKSDFVTLAANVRSKLGGKPTDTIKGLTKKRRGRAAS